MGRTTHKKATKENQKKTPLTAGFEKPAAHYHMLAVSQNRKKGFLKPNWIVNSLPTGWF